MVIVFVYGERAFVPEGVYGWPRKSDGTKDYDLKYIYPGKHNAIWWLTMHVLSSDCSYSRVFMANPLVKYSLKLILQSS